MLRLVPGQMASASGPPGLEPLRVVVADGDPKFAGDLATALRRDGRVELLEVVTSAGEALESAERLVPDVALIGDFPDTDAGEFTRSIAALDRVAVILLVPPESGERGASGAVAAALIRRAPRAEEVLEGFFEIASLAVSLQRRRGARET